MASRSLEELEQIILEYLKEYRTNKLKIGELLVEIKRRKIWPKNDSFKDFYAYAEKTFGLTHWNISNLMHFYEVAATVNSSENLMKYNYEPLTREYHARLMKLEDCVDVWRLAHQQGSIKPAVISEIQKELSKPELEINRARQYRRLQQKLSELRVQKRAWRTERELLMQTINSLNEELTVKKRKIDEMQLQINYLHFQPSLNVDELFGQNEADVLLE